MLQQLLMVWISIMKKWEVVTMQSCCCLVLWVSFIVNNFLISYLQFLVEVIETWLCKVLY